MQQWLSTLHILLLDEELDAYERKASYLQGGRLLAKHVRLCCKQLDHDPLKIC